MVRSGVSPGEHNSASVWPGAVAAGLLAAVTALICLLVHPAARGPVIWCGAVAIVVLTVTVTITRRRLIASHTALAAYAEELRQQRTQQHAETLLLAERVLPDAVDRLQQGASVEEVMHQVTSDSTLDPQVQEAQSAVIRTVLEAVAAEEGLRDSAHRAFVNIARRVQAIVHQQAQDLREMQDRHGSDQDVFADLLKLDHGNALTGRLADGIAVLGGARPGRRWSKAFPLVTVLRGAMSRIADYRRVELHPVGNVAVVGPTVEPLIHAVAELLDNATRYSPPQARVHLSATEVQSGIAIEIEDGGLSLSEEARTRAELMLKQAQEGIDLNDLGETPRLGLAVVGRLARANDFRVSLRESAYGGVRAVLVVPPEALTTEPATGRMYGIAASAGTSPRRGGRTAASAPRQRTAGGLPQRNSREAQDPAASDGVNGRPRTPGGLPQRSSRRRQTAEDTGGARTPRPESVGAPEKAAAPRATQPAPAPGAWLSAFTESLKAGETTPPAPPRQDSAAETEPKKGEES